MICTVHGFAVPDGRGKHRTAILMELLDDATRRVAYGMWSFSERSLQTQRICDILGILIVHSRPRSPQGRGKVERHFRTIREQFLRPLDQASICSLDEAA